VERSAPEMEITAATPVQSGWGDEGCGLDAGDRGEFVVVGRGFQAAALIARW